MPPMPVTPRLIVASSLRPEALPKNSGLARATINWLRLVNSAGYGVAVPSSTSAVLSPGLPPTMIVAVFTPTVLGT